jgi:hypothetical protein
VSSRLARFRPGPFRLGEGDGFDLALRLTAVALLLRPMGPLIVRPAILAAAVLALIVPRVLRHPATWFLLSLLIAARIAEDWPLSDNHIYLFCYWCLAIGLALCTTDRAEAIAFSSRWLIGLAFAFAVFWKAVLSPDFVDGRFFRVTLLTDPRFAAAARLIGGLSPAELDANRQALAPLPEGAALLDPPAVVEPGRLRAFAAISTWGVLVLEAAVAALMLAPSGRVVVALRHAALLGFCLITYAFAPVAGFGWLLLVMGLAQVTAGRPWLEAAYITAFLAVVFYDDLPWAQLLLQWTGR